MSGKRSLGVLLQVGFTANLCYHRSGWALTSPFHPYLKSCERHGTASAIRRACLAPFFSPAVRSAATAIKAKLPYPSQLFRRYISVALSRRSPAADVISYLALWSPDFPRTETFRRDRTRPFGEATSVLYHFSFILSIFLFLIRLFILLFVLSSSIKNSDIEFFSLHFDEL